jgi:hypothetical protein
MDSENAWKAGNPGKSIPAQAGYRTDNPVAAQNADPPTRGMNVEMVFIEPPPVFDLRMIKDAMHRRASQGCNFELQLSAACCCRQATP